MKAMRVVITVLLLVLALPALAQYTTVTGTVTDSAGTPYANGSFGIDYVNGAGCAGLAPAFAANPNGVLPSHWGGGFLASTGALPSMSVPDNALLVCSTSQWKYTICSNSGSTCFTSSITITGASQNIGSTLVSASTAIPGTNAAAFTSTAANPATAGLLRGPNNTTLVAARNAAASGNINVLGTNASNQAVLAATKLTASTTALASLNIPAGTAPTTPAINDVWADAKGLLMSPVAASNPLRVDGTLITLPPQTAITTVSTIQVLNGTTAITIPAGAINVVGKHVRIRGMFVFSNDVTAPVLTVSLKFGSVVLAAPVSAANANSNSSSPAFFTFDVTVSATGASGTVEAHGELRENVASAVAGAAMASYPDTVTATSSAIDLTAAITATLNLTVSSGPVTTATLRQATVEVLN
jgi:hypothetical protein